jgi:hypothetical protein
MGQNSTTIPRHVGTGRGETNEGHLKLKEEEYLSASFRDEDRKAKLKRKMKYLKWNKEQVTQQKGRLRRHLGRKLNADKDK